MRHKSDSAARIFDLINCLEAAAADELRDVSIAHQSSSLHFHLIARDRRGDAIRFLDLVIDCLSAIYPG